MRRIAAVIFLLCILSSTAGGIQITEFCPDPYLPHDPDEYLVLEGEGLLDGYTISDGEGGFRFPSGTRIDGRLVIARNGLAFEQTHGYLPDFEVEDHTPRVPDVIASGRFLLANRADELYLYNGTTLIQQIAWPADVQPREGQIHYLEDGIWDPRPLLIGQSRFSPAVFDDVTVTAFASPDCAYEVFSSTIESAKREILVNVYEFTNPAMAEDLIRARNRGVSVTVLLEGSPVGGVSPEERVIAGCLNESGIPVFVMTTTDAAHAKYRFNHAKYLVIDEETVFVGSENYKPSGYPTPGLKGNRGWGARLKDPDLAAYFREIFLFDICGGDIVPLEGIGGDISVPWTPHYTVKFTPYHATGARITPVISPDTSHLIVDMIEGAEKSIAIEQAYIKNQTKYELNPFLAAAINASRRGVPVRVLLDSFWFNVVGEEDNDEMVEVINRIATDEGLPLEAKLADLEGQNLDKLHNKGVIVDGRMVLVSSINWNANSPGFNREAGVIIEHPDIAAYYDQIFMDDWDAAGESGAISTNSGMDWIKMAAALCILAGLAVFYLYRRGRV